MEAVSTIIFAAARFRDLPELCHLRQVFTKRYRDHMDSSVNAEVLILFCPFPSNTTISSFFFFLISLIINFSFQFAGRIRKKTFSKEEKLQFMQDIAEEFSVKWDSKAFDASKSVSHAGIHGMILSSKDLIVSPLVTLILMNFSEHFFVLLGQPKEAFTPAG